MSTPALSIGDFQIHWLNGGDFMLDGGTMFGPVPKILWERKCKADAKNLLHYCNDVLLIRTPDKNIIVDTGLGNKLSDKQLAIFQVQSPWSLVNDLAELGLSRQDIDMVLLSHCDFDHAGGVVMHNQQGEEELTFPRAVHFVQETEWQDVNNPCHRAQSTYWPANFNLLKQEGELKVISGDHEVSPGITLRHSGGHTRGHQIVEICSKGETAIHLADLFPTHHHSNPLWVMAYDNFPLEVIDRKEEYFRHYQNMDSWFTFYHDPSVKACKLDTNNHIQSTWPTLKLEE
jgi:glyoxylase-like metal-dependent hydrolase (beta-lactamase superfamily II)